MDRLNAAMFPAEKRPVKVLQFGEGNFLRAFVDYFIDIANEKGVTDACIFVDTLVDRISDRFTAWGATTILTEVPEMFGAETILMSRAASREVFDRIVAMINDFKAYFRS